MLKIKLFYKIVLLFFMNACFPAAHAEPLAVTIRPSTAAPAGVFHLGDFRRPDGATLMLDRNSLRLDDQPWTPVMGEFHYSRYPETEWREELLKMKSGGISIVATYVFWIHHEEVEGEWNWTGQRNLREFVQLAGGLGLKVIVRCGPWCHGEVRNGGLPDWLVQKNWKTRTDDDRYLDQVRLLYRQIAQQLAGLRWKDGGPVIGIQLENEYGGPAEHLLTLKKIALAAGLEVPIYTRTGWPALTTPMPFGEIAPLFGAYGEGFWDRELTTMPGRYWAAFRFSTLRTDENIANEQLGRREVQDPPDVGRYPYLTCEIGGGMVSSYHRRIAVGPADIEAPAFVKLGSGSTLLGYYMYHGGTNPEGKLTTLMEAQNTLTTNWNDLPVKNYDFQAPLGQYGQIRPSYHILRRLHLFMHDFGAPLAGMPPTLPDKIPVGAADHDTLRWIVRSNGENGFVFVNNYERAAHLPAKTGVQFAIGLPAGMLKFPGEPVTVPAGSSFFWPFHFDLGQGVNLEWATAQPLCQVDDKGIRTVFFAETPGIPAQFDFAGENFPHTFKAGHGIAWEGMGTSGGLVRIVVLDEADSLALWKGEWKGKPRVFLTRAGLAIDGDALRLTSTEPADLTVGVYPAMEKSAVQPQDGIFTTMAPPAPPMVRATASFALIQPAGPAREIRLGEATQPVAAEPSDADFERAAIWRVTLPANLDLSADPILRIHYVGDVARVLLNGKLITDDFYNGNEWEIGLRRHAPEIVTGDLRIAILPLRKDAVTGAARKIYLADERLPQFGAAPSVAELDRLEIVPRYQTLVAAP